MDSETVSDTRPTKYSSVSDITPASSSKYILGLDLEKARMRKLAKPGKLTVGTTHSHRLRDAAVSTNFPEMPEHRDD
jgi:hypothetical protein